jgi:hypothetical protein
LETNLNQEKEIRERMMSEIKTSYRGADNTSENEYELEGLRQKLDQE